MDEERNYYNLTLLLSRVALPKLRDLFINEWNSLYIGTFAPWTDSYRNGSDLLRIFNTLPYEKAKVQSGDSNTWDLSLFVKILLNSRPPFVHIPNKALVEGLQCLKEIRNTLCHTSSGRIESLEFHLLYSCACSVLLLVGASTNDFKKVEEDMQKPWNEVLSLVKQCSAHDKDILQKIDTLTNEVLQGQSDIKKGIDSVLKGFKNMKTSKKTGAHELLPSEGVAANQKDGAGKLHFAPPARKGGGPAGSAKMKTARKPEAFFYSFDRSGSMSSMGDAPSKALFKETRAELADAIDGDYVYIQTFDDVVDPPLYDGPASKIKLTFEEIRIGLKPRSMTALNDSFAFVLTKAMAFCKAKPGHEVVVLIYTDGLENASKDFSGPEGLKEVNALVRKACSMGIEVIYMAANIDAFDTGSSYGVPKRSCLPAGQGNFIGLQFAREEIREKNLGWSEEVEFTSDHIATSSVASTYGPSTRLTGSKKSKKQRRWNIFNKCM